MGNEKWMSELPETVRDLAIIYLAIPGSHDSMTYGIASGTDIAPDAEDTVRHYYNLFPCIVRRWARTQRVTASEQLKLGVRYFDLRIAQIANDFYYVHDLVAMQAFEPLQQMCEYLNKYANEVIILDFQHFYDMTEAQHHRRLQEKLLEIFGKKLYSTTDGNLSDCTLNRCAQLGRQVVIIYRRNPFPLPSEFWPSFTWPTPWPNVTSTNKLQTYLDDSLLSRKPIQGYVTQCVLTPTGRFITKRLFSSLLRVAKRVNKELRPWIAAQRPGAFDGNARPTVNVFIADFVDLKNGEFCNWVIALNAKLFSFNNEMFVQKPIDIAVQQPQQQQPEQLPANAHKIQQLEEQEQELQLL